MQHGFKKLADLPDVPRLLDFAANDADRRALVFMLARQQAAKPYFAPPGVPAERLALLRRAFDETVRDPKFIALAQEGGFWLDDPMTGDELAALVTNVARFAFGRVDSASIAYSPASISRATQPGNREETRRFAMTARKLDKTQWRAFFDDLSKALEGEEAEIEVASLALGSQVEAGWLRCTASPMIRRMIS